MFDETGFFAGGGIFVDDAFAGGGIQFNLCLANFVNGVLFAIINRGQGAFYDGARLGFHQTVASATPCIFANVFLSGSGICQFRFLRIYSSVSDETFYLKRARIQNSGWCVL